MDKPADPATPFAEFTSRSSTSSYARADLAAAAARLDPTAPRRADEPTVVLLQLLGFHPTLQRLEIAGELSRGEPGEDRPEQSEHAGRAHLERRGHP